MIMHSIGPLTVYFGDQNHSVSMHQIQDLTTQKSIAFEATNPLIASLPATISSLFFTHQDHGIDSILVTHDVLASTPIFSRTADILLTNTPAIGLAIVTADCIPIIMYDPHAHAFALIHAGWRGSVAGIIKKTFSQMHYLYATAAESLHVVIGPAARGCCYQIGADVEEKILAYPWGKTALTYSNGYLYGDMVLFNSGMLESLGIPSTSIDISHSVCTVCNPSYCSYRRQGKEARRQISAAIMHLH